MAEKKKRLLNVLIDILVIFIGSCVYSAGVYFFTQPNGIAPGGVIGIASMINHVTEISVGLLYGLINVPLVIIGFIFLGKGIMLRTIFSVVLVTFVTDYFFVMFPVYTGDKILAGVFGGLLIGAGLGVIYLREGTTGGIDIVNKIISKAFPFVKMSAIILAVDAVIVTATIIVFGSVESGLYSIIAIYAGSKMVDVIVYGLTEGKLVLIFTDKEQELKQIIINEFNRGATLLDGKGAYSGAPKQIICCALRKNEYVRLRKTVRKIDPAAFMITTTAGEVVGEGFVE